MSKEPKIRTPEAFIVGRFDQDFAFVHRWFDDHIQKYRDRYTIQGIPLRIRTLDLIAEPSITEAIINSINNACMIIVDVTPLERSGELIWNPNVMYELGRAEQATIPCFRICQKRFDQAGLRLPFDISTAPINWFEITPEDLDRLCGEFGKWFHGEAPIEAYYNAGEYLRRVRRMRDEILEWKPKGYTQFQVVLNEFLGIVGENIRLMSKHIQTNAKFPLRLPDPTKMVDILFAETIKTMDTGDIYQTFSNNTFLSNIGSDSKFYPEYLAAARRGVKVQRLIMIGTKEVLSSTDIEVLREHEETAEVVPGYEVKFKLVNGTPHEHSKHSGICRWESKDETIVLKPQYEQRQGRTVLIGIDYDGRAKDYRDRFDADWKRDDTFSSIEECISSRDGGSLLNST